MDNPILWKIFYIEITRVENFQNIYAQFHSMIPMDDIIYKDFPSQVSSHDKLYCIRAELIYHAKFYDE